MTTPQIPSPRTGQHPLLILAALAVILFSLVGTAAIMGWLPSSHGNNADNRKGLTDADRAALSAGLQQSAAPGYGASNPVNGYAAPTAPMTPIQPARGAQAYAPLGGYGDSGTLGSTGAGGPDPAAPVTRYEPAPRAPAPAASKPSTHTATRSALRDEDDARGRWCANCGNVESVRTITTRAQGSGVGAAGGAILGGLLGNQLGGGHGRQLATVAGAVGGAVVGNQVEGNMKASTSYEIRVRLDDGTLRTFHQHSVPQWRTGDRVRIVKGTLHTA